MLADPRAGPGADLQGVPRPLRSRAATRLHRPEHTSGTGPTANQPLCPLSYQLLLPPQGRRASQCLPDNVPQHP